MTTPTPTVPASHRDLLDLPVVSLATIGPDGVPQVSAVWFLREDDGTVAISLNTSRQKSKNLAGTPVATLFFIDPANPYRTLEIRATVEVHPDPSYAFADRLKDKYGPSGDVRGNDRPGDSRVAVRFTPTRVNTFG